MKKLISILVSLTMLLALCAPVFAETKTEESGLSSLLGGLLGGDEKGGEDLNAVFGMVDNLLGGKGDEKSDENLSALFGMVGGLLNEEGGEKGGEGLSSLFGMVNGFLGETGGEKKADIVKADNIEQFYGTWNLVKASAFGNEIPLSEILEGADSLTLTINEKGMFVNSEKQEEDEDLKMEMKDGVLMIAVVGEDIGYIHLTSNGICFCVMDLVDLDFVTAAK